MNVAIAEELRTTERKVVAKFPDGFSEQYVAVYKGIVNLQQREEGGPAKPLEGKFIDDRRCHWTIDTFITREVFQINRAGRRSIYEKLTNVYTAPFTNEGTAFNVWALRPGNCGDTQARRESDHQNAKTAVTNRFQETINSDVEPLKTTMKNEMQASSIEIQ